MDYYAMSTCGVFRWSFSSALEAKWERFLGALSKDVMLELFLSSIFPVSRTLVLKAVLLVQRFSKKHIEAVCERKSAYFFHGYSPDPLHFLTSRPIPCPTRWVASFLIFLFVLFY